LDFELTEEQRMLGESVERFVAERYDFETRLRIAREGEGWSRAIWQEMAELGLLALPFAAEDGGFGGTGVETMIVMEALGRALVLEPYFSTVVLAGGALRIAGSAGQRQARVGRIAAGEHLMALAHYEPGAPRHFLAPATAATRDGEGWRVTGRKIAVIHGASANEFVVSAATDAGTALFIVPADAGGITIAARRGYDGVPVAEVAFDSTPVGAEALLGAPGEGETILGRLFDEANAALAAEAVGIMADTVNLTTEYLKTRVQFGVPIGSFQALQHRAVDMLVQLELARSMAILAALSLGQPDEVRHRNIAAAKAQIGRSGRVIGQQAVQLHGAIGITSEYKVGHAFKRLTAIDALFGDADHHIDFLAERGGLLATA
jgi:alkylation response protein AidB-like acyl-CoA dehydrogenase